MDVDRILSRRGDRAASLPLGSRAMTNAPVSPRCCSPPPLPLTRPDPSPAAQGRRACAMPALKDDYAWDIVEGLTTEVGPRLAGTEAEARARDWAVAQAEGDGLRQCPRRDRSTCRSGCAARRRRRDPRALPAAAGRRRARQQRLDAARRASTGESSASTASTSSRPRPTRRSAARSSSSATPCRATQDGSSYGAFRRPAPPGPDHRQPARARWRSSSARSAPTITATRTPACMRFADGATPIPAGALSIPDAEQLQRILKRGQPVTMRLVLTPRNIGTRQSGNVIAEVPGRDPNAAADPGRRPSRQLGPRHRRGRRCRRRAPSPPPPPSGSWTPAGRCGRSASSGSAPRKSACSAASTTGPGTARSRITRSPRATSAPTACGRSTASSARPARPRPRRSRRRWPRSASSPARSTRPTARTSARCSPTGLPGVDLDQDGTHYFDLHHTPDDTLDKVDPDAAPAECRGLDGDAGRAIGRNRAGAETAQAALMPQPRRESMRMLSCIPAPAARRLPGEQGRRQRFHHRRIQPGCRRECRRGRRQHRRNIAGDIGNDVEQTADKVQNEVGDVDVDVDVSRNAGNSN